ncbi:DUF6183 family protein [Streptomyces sp. WMMC500]|uniref:DUF6183 family protein n=1 Tax=Streptomyces sp. WMMC500 TaxID=3015154 RepID=UPI00248C3F27|nr:DUF6183 family protein [Streptomyces sp. WMMC500]WBB58910.1 DUF6183 family protein [Streptomyces sp. WMMC500]
MTDDRIRKIVANLPAMENVRAVWAEADERLARGDAGFAADLGVALTAAYGTGGGGDVWQYRGVFDHLLRLLATTPGPGHCAHALRLVAAAAEAGRRLDRYAASLLAGGQPAAELATAFTADAPDELRACLLHELVLRKVPVTETPGIAEWAASPYPSRHPLGRLPLTLCDVEGRPELPRHGPGGTGHAVPYGPAGHRGALQGGSAGPVPAAEETTTDAGARRMARAVANWAEESNGRVEAREFALAAPPAAGAVPETLLSLGLACLREPSPRNPFAVVPCPPAEAWRMLFAAASLGGAYNSGLGGAYGRLAAWESLAALAGVAEGAGAEDAGVGEVEARAGECAWYGFVADTAWFEQVAWDLALAAVGAEGRRLAVLAATDTD